MTTKDGLLSPPLRQRGSSPDSTRATHSLEQLHSGQDLTLEIPSVRSRGASRLSNLASPVSSEPTLPVEDVPRVNFSQQTKDASRDMDKDDDSTELEEIQPMLENCPSQMEIETADSESGERRISGSVRSWISGIMKPKASSKLPMNGLHENLV